MTSRLSGAPLCTLSTDRNQTIVGTLTMPTVTRLLRKIAMFSGEVVDIQWLVRVKTFSHEQIVIPHRLVRETALFSGQNRLSWSKCTSWLCSAVVNQVILWPARIYIAYWQSWRDKWRDNWQDNWLDKIIGFGKALSEVWTPTSAHEIPGICLAGRRQDARIRRFPLIRQAKLSFRREIIMSHNDCCIDIILVYIIIYIITL